MDGVIDIRSTSDRAAERNVDRDRGNRRSRIGMGILELVEGRISSMVQRNGGGSNVDMVDGERIARLQIQSKNEFGSIAFQSPSSHIVGLTCQQSSTVYRAATSTSWSRT